MHFINSVLSLQLSINPTDDVAAANVQIYPACDDKNDIDHVRIPDHPKSSDYTSVSDE